MQACNSDLRRCARRRVGRPSDQIDNAFIFFIGAPLGKRCRIFHLPTHPKIPSTATGQKQSKRHAGSKLGGT